MSIAKRGLNRGLDSLLSDRAKSLMKGETRVANQRIDSQESAKDGELKKLPIDKLDRGQYQPRQNFTESILQELADSIREHGVIQPIIVRRKADQRYEIIAGERRWRAARMAGLSEIPSIVRDLKDQPTLAMALIENIQRQDLNALEEAKALQRLLEEFKLTQEEVAASVGKSRSAVANSLRLLKLHPDVQTFLHEASLEMGHARAILALPLEEQVIVAKQVIQKKLSVRETERLIQQSFQAVQNEKVEPVVDSNIQGLESSLSEKLGAKIKIQHNAKGKGWLEIHYHSIDELQGILDHIQ
jgi:ParB family chromosome partitioning protein